VSICIEAAPPAVKNIVVDRKFRVADAVYLDSRAARGLYKIIAVLPDRDGEAAYSIKSKSEDFERVVAESELSPT
jgi:hypothetical protein